MAAPQAPTKAPAMDLFITELKQQYGTDDLADVFVREVKTGNHLQALRVYTCFRPNRKRPRQFHCSSCGRWRQPAVPLRSRRP